MQALEKRIKVFLIKKLNSIAKTTQNVQVLKLSRGFMLLEAVL